MSVRVMQAVWQHSKQSGGALVLLLAIADNAHDDGGGAYPSIDTLAKKARMTGRNVNILLKELVAHGEIAIDAGAGPRGVNVYRVLLPGLATPENISPLKTFHPEKTGTGGVKNPAWGGEKIGQGGVKEVSPKPSLKNHQENRQEEPSVLRARSRDLLFEAVCDVCVIDWHQMTDRERGKVNVAVGQLRKAGATPADVPVHAANYRASFTTPLTPTALANNWAMTATAQARAPNGRRETLTERNERAFAEAFNDEPADLPTVIEATWRRH